MFDYLNGGRWLPTPSTKIGGISITVIYIQLKRGMSRTNLPQEWFRVWCMYVDSWFVKGSSLEDIGEVEEPTCVRVGTKWTKMLLQMVCGFGLIVLSQSSCNKWSGISSTYSNNRWWDPKTRCIRLEKMHIGTRPVHVSLLSIAASCQGGIAKKYDMETHLCRAHGIDIVLPRGMQI